LHEIDDGSNPELSGNLSRFCQKKVLKEEGYMSDVLSDELRKLVLFGIGAAAMTAEKAGDIVEELVKKGALTVEQGKVMNEELKHTIRKNMKGCGTAAEPDEKPASSLLDELDKLSADELESLRARLAEMEKDRPDKENNVDD